MPPADALPGASFAGPLRRGAAWIVDFAVATVIGLLPTAALGNGHIDDIIGFGSLLAIWYVYLVVLESTGHRTLGQRVARVTVRRTDGAPCGWREALLRNLTKALLTPWAGALIVTLAAPDSDAAPAIAMLALLAGLVAAVVYQRVDTSGRSIGDRLAGTVVVRRASKTVPARRVPPPVAIYPAAGGEEHASTAATAVGRGRRPRVRLAAAPWGLQEVGLGALIGVGPLIAYDLLRPFHLSLSVGLGASLLTLTAIVLQDSWILAWTWRFSLRRYGLRLGDWGYRRPGLAILWLVPLSLVICVVAEFAQAPFVPGPSRDIFIFFPHTVAGGLLLFLMSCVFVPIMEETFCRGFLFRGLLKACGPWWAAIISAAAFAALHWDLWTFMPIFVGGLCLAWLYYRTNSLWTSIALHACINGVAFVTWLLL